MRKLAKDEHGNLEVTQRARHRVVVGLGWNPADAANIIDKVESAMKGKKIFHDLDLACFIYNSHAELTGVVSADPSQAIDHSGKIYHSGDNQEGFGEGDDEQISVELKDLDPDAHHIVFTATITTGHDFSEVDSPEMRIADGMSNENFLHVPISHPEGAGKDVFVFAHIYRKGDAWQLHHVAEYLKSADYENWPDELAKFLQVK